MPYFSTRLPCCALIFLRTYPAVSLFFYALSTLLCLSDILFSLTVPCAYFISTYPAVPLFYFTYPAGPLFYFHLPCCALNFLRTYPVVPSFCFHLPCCAVIFLSLTLLRYFLRTYPAVCTKKICSRVSAHEKKTKAQQGRISAREKK